MPHDIFEAQILAVNSQVFMELWYLHLAGHYQILLLHPPSHLYVGLFGVEYQFHAFFPFVCSLFFY